MKRNFSSRLTAFLPCIALLGAVHAQNAGDKPSGQSTSIVPPAPAAAAEPAEPAAKPIDLPDPVAIVNGEKISRADLQAAFDNVAKMNGMDAAQLSKLSDDQKLVGYHSVLEDLIVEKLLKEKAASESKVTDKDIDAEIEKIKKTIPEGTTFEEQLKQAGMDEAKLREQMRGGLGMRKWVESQIGDKAAVSDADAEKFYKEHIDEFKQPDQVRASHILFKIPEGAPESEVKKQEAAAKAAYEKLKKGADFAKLADELSEDPGNKDAEGKGNGGDVGFFSKDSAMVPEFIEKSFSLKKGEISEPVKTQFGYHVIKVTDTKPASTMTFDQVKDQLIGYLKNQKQQTAVQEVIGKLRSSAKVENKLPEVKQPAPPSAVPDADADAVPPAADEPKTEN